MTTSAKLLPSKIGGVLAPQLRFQFTRRTATSRIHTNGWKDGRSLGLFPLSIGGWFALIRRILGLISGLSFLERTKRLIFRRDESFYLLLTLHPGCEDAWLAAFP